MHRYLSRPEAYYVKAKNNEKARIYKWYMHRYARILK
jgi:hypothetical protein